MTKSDAAGRDHRNDNFAAIFGALFLGTGVLVLISQIFDITPSPLWIVGAAMLGIGYTGIRRAAGSIPD